MAHASRFTDGAAYDQLMGRWSRAVGEVFLDWVAPPDGLRWLEIGCGTGAFTALVVDRCAPASVAAIDPAIAQIETARGKPFAARVDLRVSEARELPFENGVFDIVASALVIPFISDHAQALGEMRRVVRPGGVIAGYLWDSAGEGSPVAPIRSALARIGAPSPPPPGRETRSLEALTALFAGCGLDDIAVRAIEVTMRFQGFDEFWRTHTPAYSPHGRVIASLSEGDRDRLKETLRASLPAEPDGSLVHSARANAIKARVPL
jgi:SAM-dependent methyltransferase